MEKQDVKRGRAAGKPGLVLLLSPSSCLTSCLRLLLRASLYLASFSRELTLSLSFRFSPFRSAGQPQLLSFQKNVYVQTG